MYTKCMQPEKSLEVWSDMNREGRIIPTAITYMAAFTACSAIGANALSTGRGILFLFLG